MEGFRAQGTRFQYAREPLYPVFLAALDSMGVSPLRCVAFVQNALCLGALYFFLRSLFGEAMDRARTLLLSSAITLLPTFLIVMNGSIYTESLSFSLICVMLGALIFMMRNLREDGSRASVVLFFGMIVFSSAALGLIKGTFAFVHLAFAGAALLWLIYIRVRSGTATNENRLRFPVLAAALIVTGIASQLATSLWLRHQQSISAAPLEVYSRGGVVLYGRTQYANRFDFKMDSARYLLCALSISAYRRLYDDDGFEYTFDAENQIGYRALEQPGSSDAELFRLGLNDLAHSPLRQAVFCFFELARFIAHHTNSGFAALTMPAVGPLVHSTAAAVLLKVFNAALYLHLLYRLVQWRRRNITIADVLNGLPPETRSGLIVMSLYVLAYLAVYSFSSTIVRMVYPVAPFLIVLNSVALIANARLPQCGAKA